jgi:hypothetical protein
MIREMVNAAGFVAVVGTERTDVPFPFAVYVALASARDHLGPVTIHARHLPYGVWWDRLRPTIELVRDGDVSGDVLPLNGLWNRGGCFIPGDAEPYASAASAYRSGGGLF